MDKWLHDYEHWVVFAIFVSDLIGTVFLIAEYYFGRPDIAVKNEAKQRKRLRIKTTPPIEPPKDVTNAPERL